MTRDPLAALDTALAKWPLGPIAIALSGGLDSTALLHALASLAAARARGLRAIHVDHAIHPDSARWAESAARYAASLDVPCTQLRVDVPRDSDLGLEGAARAARYAAIGAALAPREILVTAHHADDQAETLLLRLLRGAGVAGLAAMAPFGAFPREWSGGATASAIARPWLDVPRDAIRAYAERHALAWIEDPSNDALAHDRNFLRAEVMPRLRARWPHAERALARSAALAREAGAVVAQRVAQELELATGSDAATLRVNALAALEPFLRFELVRAWIARLGLPSPPASVLDALDTLLAAKVDATPMLRWRGVELRRYRGLVHAMAPLVAVDRAWGGEWHAEAIELPCGLGTLVRARRSADERHWVPAFAGMTPIKNGGVGAGYEDGGEWPMLRVGFRQGGERIAIAASRPTRELRLVLQELGVPPWQRERIPLVHDAQGLVAIGDLLVAERFEGRLRWIRPDR